MTVIIPALRGELGGRAGSGRVSVVIVSRGELAAVVVLEAVGELGGADAPSRARQGPAAPTHGTELLRRGDENHVLQC